MRNTDTCPVKILSAAFALLATLSSENVFAGVGEWTSSGPHGGTILNLAADPSNPATLYAATDRQVYKSVDGGQHWTVTLYGRFYLLLPTSDPSVVYSTSGGVPSVYVTADGGIHWVSHLTPVSGNPLIAVAVDPQNPRTLYAIVPVSTSISGLYRSTDGAESWTLIENPPASGVGMTAIAVDPADPAVLYVSVAYGTRSTGVYRSSNGGGSWTQTALKEPSSGVQVDPGDPSRVFALASSGLQMSTNAGASWRRIFPGSAGQFPTHLAVDPADSSRLYVVASGALFSSSDGGASARRSEDEFGGLVQAIAVSSSGAVFAGSRTGISRSEDAARSWKAANGGISEIRVDSIAVDPTDPAVVFAASPSGIHESHDGGASWDRPGSTSPAARIIAIDPTDHSTLYAAGYGVQKSTDGGRTWATRSSGLADVIYDLVIDQNNPRRLLASSWSVYRSSDGAQSWHQVMQPDDNYSSYYYPPTINAVAIAHSDSSTMYAGGQGFSADNYQALGLFYRSDNGGDHWTAMASAGSGIRALAVDSCDPGIVQAAGDNKVYRSTDGGSSWTGNPFPWDSSGLPPGLANSTVFALVRDPRHSSSIFAGTSEGVFWSNDRGVTWTRFEPALREPVRSIALDSSGRFLYAGTEKGVFGIERSFAPCTNGPDRLCLIGGKYEASLTARRRGTAVPFPGRAIEEGDRFGYFSFPDVTGDPKFPEVFVKMVDASGAPPPYGGSVWVFHSSLTDLAYTLTVRETETGRVRTYDSANTASLTCGEADTSAFGRACEAGASSIAPETRESFASVSGADLSLLGGRFRATVRATDPRTGRIVDGAAYPRADGFGYFGLRDLTGDPTFPEIFVKMVDATAQSGGYFWVFHTGLTDLDYTLTVTDVATGAVRTYSGGAIDGTRLCGEADTTAFRN